jgi:hypothetical protein
MNVHTPSLQQIRYFLQRPPCRISAWPVTPMQTSPSLSGSSKHPSETAPADYRTRAVCQIQSRKFCTYFYSKKDLKRQKNSSNKKRLKMDVPHLPHRPAVSRKHSQPLMRGPPRGPHSLTCAAVQTPPLACETTPSLRSAEAKQT